MAPKTKPVSVKKSKPAEVKEKPIKVSLFLSPDLHRRCRIEAASSTEGSLYGWIAQHLQEYFDKADKKTKTAA